MEEEESDCEHCIKQESLKELIKKVKKKKTYGSPNSQQIETGR